MKKLVLFILLAFPISAYGGNIYHRIVNSGNIISKQYIDVKLGDKVIQSVPIVNGWSPLITEKVEKNGDLVYTFDYGKKTKWTGTKEWYYPVKEVKLLKKPSEISGNSNFSINYEKES